MPYIRKPGEPPRPYRNPEKLVTIYRWIESYIAEHGYPPRIQEVVDHGFATSTSVIRYYFSQMEREGMIQITPRISRGIKLSPIEEMSKRIQDIMQPEEVEAV